MTVYACPEHPDVTSEHPDGWCFKCEEIAERDRFQYGQLGIGGPVYTAPEMVEDARRDVEKDG